MTRYPIKTHVSVLCHNANANAPPPLDRYLDSFKFVWQWQATTILGTKHIKVRQQSTKLLHTFLHLPLATIRRFERVETRRIVSRM